MSDLRKALEARLGSLPVMTYDNRYPVEALPKAELLDLLAAHPEPQPVDREALGRALGMAVASLEADDLSCLTWGRCVPCPTDGPCACSGDPMAKDELIDAVLALINGSDS